MKGSPILRDFLDLPVFFYGPTVPRVHLTFYGRQMKLSILENPAWRSLGCVESLRCQGLCLCSTASLEPKFHRDDRQLSVTHCSSCVPICRQRTKSSVMSMRRRTFVPRLVRMNAVGARSNRAIA